MFGITDSDLKYIIKLIESYNEIDEAILFGSRAMERQKVGSDIDIVLKGKNLEEIAGEIGGKLNDESPLPYYFDVLDYDSITNLDLLNHIKRVGVIIYSKSAS